MTDFAPLLLAEIRRRLLEENIPRARKCLALLSEEQIWYRPNEQSNSVGNLVLHLCGNVRQWLLSGLLGQPDVRQRQTEFDQRDGIPRAELDQQLDLLQQEIQKALAQVSPELLLTTHRVQGFDETGIAILVHITEHFSYHVGQITWIVKALLDQDMGYYAGQELG